MKQMPDLDSVLIMATAKKTSSHTLTSLYVWNTDEMAIKPLELKGKIAELQNPRLFLTHSDS